MTDFAGSFRRGLEGRGDTEATFAGMLFIWGDFHCDETEGFEAAGDCSRPGFRYGDVNRGDGARMAGKEDYGKGGGKGVRLDSWPGATACDVPAIDDCTLYRSARC